MISPPGVNPFFHSLFYTPVDCGRIHPLRFCVDYGEHMTKPYSVCSGWGWAKESSDLVLRGGMAVSPGVAPSRRDVFVSGERLVPECGNGAFEIDAGGLLVFPSPINTHDHLLGSWAPRIRTKLYENVYEWLEELHGPDHEVRLERDANPVEDVYLLGVYKNISSGTSTVVDHFLRRENEFWEKFPMRIFHRFGRTWAMRKETGWGGTIEEELKDAGENYPYIIHISEGVDEETSRELKELAERGGVRANSMLVHGVAFDGDDMDVVAEKKASISWCPSSNMFLYDKTLDVRSALERGINVCLGTDSTLSGCDNIFDEIRFAESLWEKSYGEQVDSEILFRMLTLNAAHALLLDGEIGCLDDGALADVIVAESKCDNPVESYLKIKPEDVDLLLVGGRPVFGGIRHKEYFSSVCGIYSVVSVNGSEKVIVGDPEALLARIYEKVGFEKELPFLPFDV